MAEGCFLKLWLTEVNREREKFVLRVAACQAICHGLWQQEQHCIYNRCNMLRGQIKLQEAQLWQWHKGPYFTPYPFADVSLRWSHSSSNVFWVSQKTDSGHRWGITLSQLVWHESLYFTKPFSSINPNGCLHLWKLFQKRLTDPTVN